MTSMRTQLSQRRYSGAAIVVVCSSRDLDGTPNRHEEELLSSTGSPP